VQRALLQDALDQAARDGVTVTDEAMAVERLGRRVAAVVGSPRNLKITTPHDLRWAELLLASAVEKA
jgi:2-C-methyl-D-erythritol 4-phosphate cytidylyltransferase